MQLSKFVFPLLLAATFTVSADETAPVSPEKDTDKVIEFTTALETDPLGNDATAQRKWLLQWLTDTPDFTVTVCDILGPIPNESVPNGPELLVQQMFGNVAYQIKHPGAYDETSLQIAGVESVLRAYSNIIRRDPSAHIAYFDNLLMEQEAGSLKEHMSSVIAKGCANDDGA